MRTILLLLGSLFFTSCTPIYFDQPNFESRIRTNGLGTYDEKFEFNLVPIHFFKNNRLSSSLLSDSAYFIKNHNFFHFRASEGDFYGNQCDDCTSDVGWTDSLSYNIKAYIFPKLDKGALTQPIVFVTNQLYHKNKVLSVSQNNVENAKSKNAQIFYGNIVNTLVDRNPAETIVFIDSVEIYVKKGCMLKRMFDREPYHMTFKKLSKKPFGYKPVHDPLALIMVREKDRLIIKAIVDRNFFRRNNTSTIYDMKQIFNEDIILNKK